MHICPPPDKECWTTCIPPAFLNAILLWKTLSLPLLHAVNWKSPYREIHTQRQGRGGFQKTLSETPPLPCTWPRPSLTSTWVASMNYQTQRVQQGPQCPALRDTEWTSKKKGGRRCVCVHWKAVGNLTLRGRAGQWVGAEGLGRNPRAL